MKDMKGEMINRAHRAGFTLLELLVVIIIIGILLGIMLPAFTRIRETARKKRRDSDLKTIPVAVRNYYQEKGEWPVPDQDDIDDIVTNNALVFINDNHEVVDILVTPVSGLTFLQIGDYVSDDDGNILDPWRKPYRFVFHNTNDFDRIDFILEQQ